MGSSPRPDRIDACNKARRHIRDVAFGSRQLAGEEDARIHSRTGTSSFCRVNSDGPKRRAVEQFRKSEACEMEAQMLTPFGTQYVWSRPEPAIAATKMARCGCGVRQFGSLDLVNVLGLWGRFFG